MSINDLMNDCIKRGMSEEDTVLEFLRKFPKNTIKNMGGQKRIKELYRKQTAQRP